MKKLVVMAVAMMLSGCATVFSGPQCNIESEVGFLHVSHAERAAVVHFANGKADISKKDMEIIKKVATRAIIENAKVVVYGHASHRTLTKDPIQHVLVNLDISNERAIRVSRALAKYGVPKTNIHPVAMFDSRPLRKEVTRADEATNRRAELYLYWFE